MNRITNFLEDLRLVNYKCVLIKALILLKFEKFLGTVQQAFTTSTEASTTVSLKILTTLVGRWVNFVDGCIITADPWSADIKEIHGSNSSKNAAWLPQISLNCLIWNPSPKRDFKMRYCEVERIWQKLILRRPSDYSNFVKTFFPIKCYRSQRDLPVMFHQRLANNLVQVELDSLEFTLR